MKRLSLFWIQIIFYLFFLGTFEVAAEPIITPSTPKISVPHPLSESALEKMSPPLRGYSVEHAGVIGLSGTLGIGVQAENNSSDKPAAMFRNFGTGDHLIINNGEVVPALRVGNSGDVYVRGRLLGQKGEKGDPGAKGAQGIPGPVSRAGCFCSWQSTNKITGFCDTAGGSGQAIGGIAECVSTAQQASTTSACNIRCP